jgi:mono/diheme cytochrome c family protein
MGLKWLGIILGGFLGLLLIAALGLYAKTRMQFNKIYHVQVESVVIPTNADSIEHGKHLAAFLCMECHGEDLGGTPNWKVLSGIAAISPPNITLGKGSAIAHFTDEDLVRVLRHGVKPDGKSVFVMPSMYFHHLNDEDLSDLLAYLKSVPPVERGKGSEGHVRLTFLGNVLYGAGAFGNLLSAEVIDYDSRPTSFPTPGVTVEYGEYLININGCRGCHGAQLAGGKPPDPESTLAPNLTPGGELTAWTDADFIRALRTGIALSGHQLNPKFMPWEYKGRMTDDELKAIFLCLQSLPKLPTSTAPVH